MIVEIQVLPTPSGRPDDRYAHVDAAIAAIKSSGVRHEVGPLGTWMEAEAEVLWPLMRAVHEATLAAGASSVVTIVKIAEAADPARMAADQLIAPHR